MGSERQASFLGSCPLPWTLLKGTQGSLGRGEPPPSWFLFCGLVNTGTMMAHVPTSPNGSGEEFLSWDSPHPSSAARGSPMAALGLRDGVGALVPLLKRQGLWAPSSLWDTSPRSKPPRLCLLRSVA